jgi:enoyl-CoA hydratase
MEFENLIVTKNQSWAQVTVNRPAVLNALNEKTRQELVQAFSDLARDPAIKAIILTGAGDRAFIAGAEIQEFEGWGAVAGAESCYRGQAVCDRIENVGKPVIAAINGFALGGGCELAMACHLRIASSKAKIGQPEINLGIMPGYGGTQRLARLVGEGRAMELILTGDAITADEAYRIGLVNKVVAPEELMPTATALAEKLAGKGPLAVRHAMEAIHYGLQGSLAEGLRHEAHLFGLCFATEDKNEGVRAFLEKRPAKFQGR